MGGNRFRLQVRFVLVAFLFCAVSFSQNCHEALSQSATKLRIATYNTLNLYIHRGSYKYLEGSRNLRQVSQAHDKPLPHVKNMAAAMNEIDADIWVLQEVETAASLAFFNRSLLQDKYHIYILPGNDSRNIQIAFLVKKTIPWKVKFISHKDQTWRDPTKDGNEVPVFNRDFPLLLFYDEKTGDTKLAVFGAHIKSMKFRPGDEESVLWRTAEAKAAVKVIRGYQKYFENKVPMIVAGDFNGEVYQDNVYRPFLELAHLQDAFELLDKPPPYAERISHTYHPSKGEVRKRQMDYILLSEHFKNNVKQAKVYRYKDEDGSELPIPDRKNERRENPSDHFPYYMDIEMDFSQQMEMPQQRVASRKK